jgi:sucrose phosphorylase
VLSAIAPHVILITETNVPHRENISYFGDGTNEAHLVYNFTLPPLLLHTLVSGNADKLTDWINNLNAPIADTAFFNFTASHDGIGVRPVEGLLTDEELQKLIETVEQRGGRVSYRANSDGSRSPYELNITYVDAVAPHDMPEALRISCFLLSQAVMLSLAGVPAVYIHSLLGSHNDIAGMQETGQNRSINRAKLHAEEIEVQLADANSFRAKVFNGYTHMLKVRTEHSAFHPHGKQQALVFNNGQVFAVERTAPDGSERILALFNVTDQAQTIELQSLVDIDVLTGEECGQSMLLAPYQTRWLHQTP